MAFTLTNADGDTLVAEGVDVAGVRVFRLTFTETGTPDVVATADFTSEELRLFLEHVDQLASQAERDSLVS